MLPSCADASFGDRADVARRRRTYDGRDRECVSRARSNDGAAHQPRQTEHQELGSELSHADRDLIFNEGYASSAGPTLQRVDLSSEAIRLARGVYNLLPEHGEVGGLLALILLTDARRMSRSGPDGELIPLDEQDRSLWDRAAITEGVALVSNALSRGAVGAYQLQAAIAAVHDEAARTEDTDWSEIVALYGLLMRMSDNPMVRLNHAVAVSMVRGPAAGLELLVALDADPRMKDHRRLAAVRGHLWEKSGDHAAAIIYFRAAAGLTSSIAERDYMLMKAARLAEAHVER